MRYQRVLVTGGAGFIGSQVVRDLIGHGYRVNVLDNLSTGSKENLGDYLHSDACRLFEGSVESESDISEAMDSCDAVIHMAVSNLRVSIANPLSSHETNTAGTFRVLECARRTGIERFVYISSSEVYGEAIKGAITEEVLPRPTTLYASSKLAGEHYTLSFYKMYGLNATVVRPFNTFGPRSHHEGLSGEIIPRSVLRLLNRLPPVLFGNGKQTRDFLYVTDTARGILQTLECDQSAGMTLNIASGKEVSMHELTNRLCDAIAPDLRPIYVGFERPGDLSRLVGSSDLAKQTLGFEPRVSIEDGLALYVAWIRAQATNPTDLLNSIKERNW